VNGYFFAFDIPRLIFLPSAKCFAAITGKGFFLGMSSLMTLQMLNAMENIRTVLASH
jgi:hypothetical protein